MSLYLWQEYCASYGLADEDEPSSGVPYYCVGITASVSLLTFLSCTSGANKVFEWFQNLTTIANLFTWVSVCIAYIRFYAAMKAQDVDRKSLIFRSPFQPYLAWVALIFFSTIILFNGFYVFLKGNWSITSFLTAYIGIPIYLSLFLFWKIFKKTRFIPAVEADIFTGKAALDAEIWPDRVARNIFERVRSPPLPFLHAERLSLTATLLDTDMVLDRLDCVHHARHSFISLTST